MMPSSKGGREMPNRKSVLLLCLAGLLLTTGCWDRRELNTIGIVVGLGIDLKDGLFDVSVQMINPNQQTSTSVDSQTKVALYKQKSSTVKEAMRKISAISPRINYLSHLRIFILGEELAKEDIEEVLDYLSRDHEVRSDFYIVIAKGLQASDLLSILTQIDTIPAIRMYNMLNLSAKMWAPTLGIRMIELIKEQGNHYGKTSVLSGIGVRGDLEKIKTKLSDELIDPPGRIYYGGIAVMKDHKLAGWLSDTDSESYVYLVDKVKYSVLQVPCGEDGKAVLEVMGSRTKRTVSLSNGKPSIKAVISMKADVSEFICEKSLLSAEMIDELENSASDKLKRQLEKTVKHVQHKYQADIFGFGELIYRKYPKEWKRLEPDWEQLFKDLPVEVEVKVKINHLGTVNEQLYYEESD